MFMFLFFFFFFFFCLKYVGVFLSQETVSVEVLLAPLDSAVQAMHNLEGTIGIPSRRPSVSAIDSVVMRGVLYLGLVHDASDAHCRLQAVDLLSRKTLWISVLDKDRPCRCHTHRSALYARGGKLMCIQYDRDGRSYPSVWSIRVEDGAVVGSEIVLDEKAKTNKCLVM